MVRVAAWAGFLVVAVLWLTILAPPDALTAVAGQIAVQVVAIGVLLAWTVTALVRPAWRPTTPLLEPVLLVVGAYLLSALLSQLPRLTLEPTMAGVGYAVTFLFLTRFLADPWFRQRVKVLLVLVVVLVSVGYVIQVVGEWITWWSLVGRFAIPPLRPNWAGLFFGHPNIVAAFLVITAPLGVVLIARQTRHRAIPVAVALVVLFAIVVSGSRGAWIGIALAAVVAVALALDRSRGSALVDLRTLLARSRVALVGVLAVAGLAVVLAPVVLARFAVGGDTLRLDLWKASGRIFLDHPLTGGGPGTWVLLKVDANPAGAANYILQHAHNLYIQAAAELGLVGLAALAFLAVVVVVRLVRVAREGSALAPESAAVVVGLAAFAGQSLVDNFVQAPVICLAVLVVVAWIEGGLPAKPASHTDWLARPRRLLRGPLVPAAILVALVAAVPVLARIDGAALDAQAGDRAAVAEDWEGALVHLDAAIAADDQMTIYRIQRAGVLARLGRMDEALADMRIATATDHVGINLISRAALELEAGDVASAFATAQRAVAVSPYEPTVALNAGLIAERAGDRAFALDQFAITVVVSPPLAGAEIWDDPARLVTRDEILDAARAFLDPVHGALITAYAGDASQALDELSSLPASRLRDVHLAAAQWLAGDPEGAKEALIQLVDGDPRDTYAAAWLARIARRSGDEVTAERYTRWTILNQADASTGTIYELSEVGAEGPAAAAALPLTYPRPIYMRRAGSYVLAPQLLVIGAR